jgi:hypothetical protein
MHQFLCVLIKHPARFFQVDLDNDLVEVPAKDLNDRTIPFLGPLARRWVLSVCVCSCVCSREFVWRGGTGWWCVCEGGVKYWGSTQTGRTSGLIGNSRD